MGRGRGYGDGRDRMGMGAGGKRGRVVAQVGAVGVRVVFMGWDDML